MRLRVIRVRAGAPVRLDFHRDETNPCTEEVVIPDFGIRTYLPAHRTTPVSFTPAAGTYRVHLRHGDGARHHHRESGEPCRDPRATDESCTIPVTGMTCAACSARVQRALERTDRCRVGQREPDDRRRHGGLRPRRHVARAAGGDHSRRRATAPSCRSPRNRPRTCSTRRTRRARPSCARSGGSSP